MVYLLIAWWIFPWRTVSHNQRVPPKEIIKIVKMTKSRRSLRWKRRNRSEALRLFKCHNNTHHTIVHTVVYSNILGTSNVSYIYIQYIYIYVYIIYRDIEIVVNPITNHPQNHHNGFCKPSPNGRFIIGLPQVRPTDGHYFFGG